MPAAMQAERLDDLEKAEFSALTSHTFQLAFFCLPTSRVCDYVMLKIRAALLPLLRLQQYRICVPYSDAAETCGNSPAEIPMSSSTLSCLNCACSFCSTSNHRR